MLPTGRLIVFGSVTGVACCGVAVILSCAASTRVILAALFVSHGIEPMRVALMILLGLVVGVLGTAQVMNVLAARNPMPKAVMETMGYHMGELSHALKAKQCDAAKIQHHLERVQSTATDIVPVFGIGEKSFADKAGELQTHLQQAVQAAPADCAALAAAVKPIGETCKSCHQQYR
jgi:cytochrome c556